MHSLEPRKVTTAGKNKKKKFQKGRLLDSPRSSLVTNRPEAICPHLLCTCLKDAACILRARDRKAEQTQGRAAQRECFLTGGRLQKREAAAE